MKIDRLQISNVLSFPYVENIEDASPITFDSGLNIIIGENGAGKSTALEVINFLFRRVLYKQYSINQDLFGRRTLINADERRQIIQPANQNSFSGFRLEPNWDNESSPQVIRLIIRLDEIDLNNIKNLRGNFSKIHHAISLYSPHSVSDDGNHRDVYTVEVTLNRDNNTFSVGFPGEVEDFGFTYLSEYHFLKQAIEIQNIIAPEHPIPPLYESFTLITSYRNYHAFQPSISLKDAHPTQQIQKIKNQGYNRSLNASDQSEPPIFGLVRLQVAERHFDLIRQAKSENECEEEANDLDFLKLINARLEIVNLICKIKLIELRTWQYNFEFWDTRRQKVIQDINSLSAGQKAIIHLVFEAYGQGDLKGGVVIIDEPEIHLHYQFQHEYLQVINDLNRDQNCQYILVTHSEALINSSTINSVRRFSLNEIGHTEINSPNLRTDQKSLIKILDNTRSTYAFFAKKVVLVEGDSDRYFFRAIIQDRYRHLDQEIAVLHIGGKNEFGKWTDLFSAFGLDVTAIADFDYLSNLYYPSEKSTSLKTTEAIEAYKARNGDWETNIEAERARGVHILKDGNLEAYLGIRKDLSEVINFCRHRMTDFLQDDSSAKSREIRGIMESVTR